MLSEAKVALQVTSTAYDGEIALLLDAGAKDLTMAGVTLPGTVSFSNDNGVITDNSTLTDALCMRAIITYARMYFGSPDDFERIRMAYDVQKVQLMHASGYTDFGDDEDDEGGEG